MLRASSGQFERKRIKIQNRARAVEVTKNKGNFNQKIKFSN